MPEAKDQQVVHILSNWVPRQYLDYYYGHPSVPDDEDVMFRFIANGLAKIGTRFATGLELGCGPVLHHAAQLVRWCDRLDMADVVDGNLDEIRKWIAKSPDAFDWSIFIGGERGVLDAEGTPRDQLAAREAAMRERIRVMKCDLREDHPLGAPAQYPLVASFYCAEWVVPTIEGWQGTMQRVASVVAPGGWLFLCGVHDTEYCMINGRPATCARVTDVRLREVLERQGFVPSTIHIAVTPGLRPEESGIRGTFMAYAQRAS